MQYMGQRHKDIPRRGLLGPVNEQNQAHPRGIHTGRHRSVRGRRIQDRG